MAAWTYNEFVESLANTLINNSPFPALSGQPMPNQMVEQMEAAVENIANPVYNLVLSYAILPGTLPATYMVKGNIDDLNPGYLDSKIDNNTLKLNTLTQKVYVDAVPLANDIRTGGIRIGSQPYLYMAGNNIMLNVDTANDLPGGSNTVPTSLAVRNYVNSVVSLIGTSGGDMFKILYDTNDNGIVDNSERLNSQLPSYYLSWVNFTNTPDTINGYGITDAYTKSEINVFFDGEVSGKKQITWSNVLNKPTVPTFQNGVDNRVLTYDGGLLNGEENLIFNGNTLTVTGDINISGNIYTDNLRERTTGNGIKIAHKIYVDNISEYTTSTGITLNNTIYLPQITGVGTGTSILFYNRTTGQITYGDSLSGADGVLTAVDASDITAVDFTITGASNILNVDFGHLLQTHDNVSLSGLTTNDILVYNGTNWVNTPIPTSGTGNAFSFMYDGTNTASASGSDTFRFRSANNILTLVVANNDATYGDNILLTINAGNISHNSLGSIGVNDHHNQVHSLVGSDHSAAGLTIGYVIRATGTTTFAWQQLLYTDLGNIPTTFSPSTHATSHNDGGSDEINLSGLSGTPAALTTHIGSSDHDSRYYTETELQTTGQSQVHWGNLTNVPSTFTPSTHTHVYTNITDFSTGVSTYETSHATVIIDSDFASQGLMRRGATSGVYSIITDNSANWNTAYSHSQIVSGNPHQVTYAQLGGTQPPPISHTLEGHTATTVTGSLLKGSGTNTFAWFARGTSSQVLRVNVAGTDLEWVTPSGSLYTPAALTRVNDTNVTLTLGGTPTTALLQAVSLTLGWTGTLADARIASAATWNAKQTGHANLTSLSTLTYASTAFVKMSGTNTFSLDTNAYWHSGNDGSGSGLDADLWDGNQFSSYLNQALLTTSYPVFTGMELTSSSSVWLNLRSTTGIASDIVGIVFWNNYDNSVYSLETQNGYFYLMNDNGNKFAFVQNPDAGFHIYYNNSEKFQTTNSGISITGSVTASGQLISSVTTGTSPLSITSTTLVTNLNADLWDGAQFATYLNQALLTTSNPTFNRLYLTSSTSTYIDVYNQSSTGFANLTLRTAVGNVSLSSTAGILSLATAVSTLIIGDNPTGSLKLCYNGDTKVETTNTGINITGNSIISGQVNASTVETGIIYSLHGTITTGSATTIITTVDACSYILTIHGKHTDYNASNFGYGVWMITRVYEDYTATWITKVLPLFTETFSNQINVTVSGYNVQVTYSIGGTGNSTIYWEAIRLR